MARVVDAAIVEALSFLVARAQRDGVNIDGREAEPWTLVELARIAALALEREGYAPDVAMKGVAKRLKRRDQHTRPDFVPSLEPGPIDRIPETKAGPWRTALTTVLDILKPRSPSRA